MLKTTNKVMFEYNLDIAKKLLRFNVSEAQEKRIRRSFDIAFSDTSMLAAIAVAKEQGFDDLAADMEEEMRIKQEESEVENV